MKWGVTTKPYRWLCFTLDVTQLAAENIFSGRLRSPRVVQLLGPRVHKAPVSLEISTIITGNSATLMLSGHFPACILAQSRPARVPPYTHWYLVCDGCFREVRKLFLPSDRRLGCGPRWACWRCHGIIYPRPDRPMTVPTSHQMIAAGLDEDGTDLNMALQYTDLMSTEQFIRRTFKKYNPIRGRGAGA